MTFPRITAIHKPKGRGREHSEVRSIVATLETLKVKTVQAETFQFSPIESLDAANWTIIRTAATFSSSRDAGCPVSRFRRGNEFKVASTIRNQNISIYKILIGHRMARNRSRFVETIKGRISCCFFPGTGLRAENQTKIRLSIGQQRFNDQSEAALLIGDGTPGPKTKQLKKIMK